MIYNPTIKQPFTTRELRVMQNGEYLPSANHCDAFSKVTVNLSHIKLATPTVVQKSNYVAVLHDNDVWANEFEFYVDGTLVLTTTTPYADLHDILPESGSGSVCARAKYNKGMVRSSDFSNTIVCGIQTYAECVVELHEPTARVLRLADGVNPMHVTIPPYALIEGKFFPITEIGENAFAGNTTMESVGGTFIEKIYKGAFKGASLLVSMTFPYLKEIYGSDVFSGTKLTRLKLDEIFSLYAPGILKDNLSPTIVDLPETEYFDAILPKTFENADMNYLFTPSNVKRIDENAFVGSSLKYLEIESENVEISKNAFSGSDLKTQNGYVFVRFADLQKYLGDEYNSTFGNLACTVDVEYQEEFIGTKTIASKTCKFQLFSNYSSITNEEFALNVSGENWISDGNLRLYAKITVE